MMKLISWNIDSLNAALTSDSDRARLTRTVLDTIIGQNADIIAIQETKLPPEGPSGTLKELIAARFPDYEADYAVSQPPAKKSYAGTMILRRKPYQARISVPVLNAPDTMDLEGRLQTAEFDDFYFVNVYTPNAGEGLKRLEDRQQWDVRYTDYLTRLDRTKPVIACGDFNVAHREIDLANPDANRQTAGFTDEERQGFSALLSRGFTDTFRYIHGDVEKAYSWWSQRIRTSKVNNAGWRIDYFIVSDRIRELITKSEMIDSGARQDHAPIMMEIAL